MKGFQWPREDGGEPPGGGASFRARVEGALVAFSSWFQIKAQPVLRKFDWALIRTCAFILALTFVLASSVSTFAANMALNYATGQRKGTRAGAKTSVRPVGGKGAAGAAGAVGGGEAGAGLGLGDAGMGNDAGEVAISVPYVITSSGPSGSELRKGILDRNVFNSEGKLAVEAETEGGVKKTKDLDFDAVPCSNEKLPVEVVGTIFTGDPLRSFVSVRDSKVSDNDTYRHGNPIIEHEEYEVHKVFRGSVEFRKGDTKICVALKGFEKEKSATGEPTQPTVPGSVRPDNVENLDFDSAYVQGEIGPGYANILNSAKLIPEVEPSGKTAGFKIIAITAGSLFDKMKLSNGDVITEVNGVSLRDASQGFKLYQALQEEREITVNLTRGGEPMVRKVRVK